MVKVSFMPESSDFFLTTFLTVFAFDAVECIEYTEDGKTARIKFADEESVLTSLGILNGSTTATGFKITVTHSLPN